MSATLGLSETEWHAVRARHIGSSEVSALFGVQPDYALSHFALWHVKAGNIPPPVVDNDRVRFGTKLEPLIAELAAEENGWTITKGRYHEDPLCPGLGASLDYEIDAPGPGDDGCEGPGVLECKNVDWMVHRRSWADGEPPIHITLQLQTQLACSGRTWGCVVALVGGNQLLTYRFQARPKIVADIRRRTFEFWSAIDAGQEPLVDGKDSTSDALRALFPEVTSQSLDLRTHNEFPIVVAALLSKTEERKRVTEEEEELKNRLRAILGDAKSAWCDQFSVSVAVTPAKPDRLAREGEIIKGRAESRRIMPKERVSA
jgi:predicted phage-related endonuclease